MIKKSKINEEEYNYHYSGGKEVDSDTPYVSDNKNRMLGGRSTGHFGSGIYFSTYKTGWDKKEEVYGFDDIRKDTPEFIKIKDGVYRVDFDLYKNLYRVNSENEGKVLFTLLKNLNLMYNNVSYHGLDNALFYQRCKVNANALNLNIPNYRQLTNMMVNHSKNDDDVRSFSTVFMEMNGYNGVNVSGISLFDNTLHGSVIYDLKKTSLTPVNDIKPNKFYNSDSSEGNTFARKDIISNAYDDSLKGFSYPTQIAELDDKLAFRVLRNNLDNGKLFNGTELRIINKPKVIKKYLRLIYNMKFHTRWDSFDEIVRKYELSDIIVNTESYYWLNYNSKHNDYIFSNFCDRWYNEHGYDGNASDEFEEYLDMIKSKIGRDFNEDEIGEIEFYRDLLKN